MKWNQLWLLYGLLLAGCGEQFVERELGKTYDLRYLETTEPANVIDVKVARAAASTTDQEVAVVGRVGGSTNPFVDGLAAFTLLDLSIPQCASDPNCTVDCAVGADELKQSIVTVKLVDEAGQLVVADARNLLPLKPNSIVVVKGAAKIDPYGNFSILTQRLSIRTPE
jgi:hypothetical protein